jgi:hypothetical protein
MQPARAPWHLWAAGLVSLLWNAYGAYDYTMSVTRNPSYLANYPAGTLEVLNAMPRWAIAAWAVGVWASLAGSILLLLRSRHAAPVFVLSLAGALISFGYQATMQLPPSMAGPSQWIMPVVIALAILAQWYYARRMAAAGVLR